MNYTEVIGIVNGDILFYGTRKKTAAAAANYLVPHSNTISVISVIVTPWLFIWVSRWEQNVLFVTATLS